MAKSIVTHGDLEYHMGKEQARYAESCATCTANCQTNCLLYGTKFDKSVKDTDSYDFDSMDMSFYEKEDYVEEYGDEGFDNPYEFKGLAARNK